MTEELKQLREALRRVKYEAVSLADAQVIALEALTAAQPAQAERGVVLPAGWVPLTIEHEPGFPEEVAFGPQRMMDRLKKWLDKHFAALAAQPAAQADSMGMPTSCGKPLCSPDEHHPLCRLHKPAAQATPEPVQADSSEHLRVIASLGAALRRLSFAAQTSGGTAGTDAELQAAIGQAEQALSFGGIAQAMFATPPQQAAGEPPVGDGFVAFKAKCDEVFGWVVGLGGYEDAVREAWKAAHPAPGVPEGFALVPVEPTAEMMEAMPSLPAIGAPGDMELKAKGWSLKAIQNRHRWLAALAAAQAKGGDHG